MGAPVSLRIDCGRGCLSQPAVPVYWASPAQTGRNLMHSCRHLQRNSRSRWRIDGASRKEAKTMNKFVASGLTAWLAVLGGSALAQSQTTTIGNVKVSIEPFIAYYGERGDL